MPAFYIVLQEKIPGVDAAGLENFALSKHSVKLETLAKQADVTPLLNFFSADPEEMAGLLGEHSAGVKIPVQIPEEKWFSPEEGLQTIGALLQSLANTPSAEGANPGGGVSGASAGSAGRPGAKHSLASRDRLLASSESLPVDLLPRQQKDRILRQGYSVRLRGSGAERSRQIGHQRIGSVRSPSRNRAGRGVDDCHRTAIAHAGVDAAAVFGGRRRHAEAGRWWLTGGERVGDDRRAERNRRQRERVNRDCRC
jgi:hypothetical protein